MQRVREVEATYDVSAGSVVPELTDLAGVVTTKRQPSIQQSAVYFDTADLVLRRHGVSLRRRSGGTDDGWHLKIPHGDGRDELRRPLGRSTVTPPKQLRDLVAGWVRGVPLAPVATVETTRVVSLLSDAEGEPLGEFADDRVVGTTTAGDRQAWREWEVELVGADPEFLSEVDRLFAAAGIERAAVSSKVIRTLGDRVPGPSRGLSPKRGKAAARVVDVELRAQVAKLATYDVDVRLGQDEGVHKMRVECRRLRSLLGTFRPLLDREVTDPIRDELRWLGGLLGAVRDGAVVQQRLRDLVAEEPRVLVQGPVVRRLRGSIASDAKAELSEALASQRYFDLRAKLDELVSDPPWSELADEAARDVVPDILAKELERFRRRAMHAATSDDRAADLHDVRKEAKRLRYAAEAVESIAGKRAHDLRRTTKHVVTHLGELQDTILSRSELVAIAADAAAAGEPTFTYGRLHAREELRARHLVDTFDIDAAIGAVRHDIGSVRKVLRGT